MSWLDLPPGSPYGIETLPYGVFSDSPDSPRVGVRFGDQVLDLAAVAEQTGQEHADVFAQPSLNALMTLGTTRCSEIRSWVRSLFLDRSRQEIVSPHLFAVDDVEMRLPIVVADYVDFYASESHASNVGQIFRPDSPALPASWKHLPIGYHGRAGTVVVSGTDVVRPCGQRQAPTESAPTYGPSRRLDIEAEVGFVVGTPTRLGDRVSTADFGAHVFGVVLVNDWSARDIQAWEYVPLGPFLGKSFATSISPWVVPLDALAAARVAPPAQDPTPLEYLADRDPWALDLTLEVEWNGEVVARPPFASMYWTPGQQLAHLTVNGASLRTGDLYASGTVSGPERGQRGSFLELSWGGTEPFEVAGAQRTFLEDGDTVSIRALAPGADGTTVGFGAVTGTVLPAR
ncbi:MAG: fumarylacetoacetase [Geodermatophilaceae bacterium]|nr:fumarylacetoacetase [Geodermatophilaceae bacterium]